MAGPGDLTAYQRWIEGHEPAALAQWASAPIVPAAAGPSVHFLIAGDGPALEDSIRSLLAQSDPNWRLWTTCRETLACQDARIRTVAAQPSVVHSWNAALQSIADGLVAVLHASDQPGAGRRRRAAARPDSRAATGMIYSDEDALDDAGRRRDPLFKPDWSPETFRATELLGNLTAFRSRYCP